MSNAIDLMKPFMEAHVRNMTKTPTEKAIEDNVTVDLVNKTFKTLLDSAGKEPTLIKQAHAYRAYMLAKIST